MNAQVWIAILVGLAASIEDLARRRISNWISLAALAAGTGWQMSENGWRGSYYALAGAAAGFSVFLIFNLLGGMGGGDIKLMTGFGALLGVGRLLEAALWIAGTGGILAMCVVAARWLRQAVGKSIAVKDRAEDESIPYAPAIALGVWLSLVPKG